MSTEIYADLRKNGTLVDDLDLLIAGVAKKFKVKSLIIFSSVARDEADAESDLDLLVEFEQTVETVEYK